VVWGQAEEGMGVVQSELSEVGAVGRAELPEEGGVR